MSDWRKYLAVFVLPITQPEHAKIKDAIKHHSEGDFQCVFTHGVRNEGGKLASTIAYVFMSESHPRNMGFGVLNQDSYFVVELGNTCSEQGMNLARGWMRRHRPK